MSINNRKKSPEPGSMDWYQTRDREMQQRAASQSAYNQYGYSSSAISDNITYQFKENSLQQQFNSLINEHEILKKKYAELETLIEELGYKPEYF